MDLSEKDKNVLKWIGIVLIAIAFLVYLQTRISKISDKVHSFESYYHKYQFGLEAGGGYQRLDKDHFITIDKLEHLNNGTRVKGSVINSRSVEENIEFSLDIFKYDETFDTSEHVAETDAIIINNLKPGRSKRFTFFVPGVALSKNYYAELLDPGKGIDNRINYRR